MKIGYLADNIQFRETIASWFMDEWGKRYPERDINVWVQEQTYPNRDRLPLTLVAIEEGKVVGTVSLRQDGMTTHSEWVAWLSYLVVAKSHRGKGIAKMLLQEADAVAKSLNIEELHLFTRLSDTRLYSNSGWKQIATENYRDGEVYIMQKTIANNYSSSLYSFFQEHPYISTGIAAALATAFATTYLKK